MKANVETLNEQYVQWKCSDMYCKNADKMKSQGYLVDMHLNACLLLTVYIIL